MTSEPGHDDEGRQARQQLRERHTAQDDGVRPANGRNVLLWSLYRFSLVQIF